MNSLKHDSVKNICVMSGAGISVAAGIPDFRTPGSGIYSRMEAIIGRKLKKPELLFDLKFFLEEPEVYYAYRKIRFKDYDEMGTISPTFSHYFIRLLQERNQLAKCFTQNVDGLHVKSGIDPKLLVEAHGNGN